MAVSNYAGTMYTTNSYLRDSRYRSFYLDVAKLPIIANVTGDSVIVPPECENRIDLFSYQQYGSSRYWWMIALANADLIKDPIWDFTAGLTVLVPRDTALLEKLAGVN
jgi:hypothetical protein